MRPWPQDGHRQRKPRDIACHNEREGLAVASELLVHSFIGFSSTRLISR